MLVLSLILSATNVAYAKWDDRKRARADGDCRLSEEDGGMLGAARIPASGTHHLNRLNFQTSLLGIQ